MKLLNIRYAKLIPSFSPGICSSLTKSLSHSKSLVTSIAKLSSSPAETSNKHRRHAHPRNDHHFCNGHRISSPLVLFRRDSSVSALARFFKTLKSEQPSAKDGSLSDHSDSDDEDLFHEPPRVKFGMLKVTLTIILGTYFGAMFAKFGANLLEEYEIFVKGEDDDDDD